MGMSMAMGQPHSATDDPTGANGRSPTDNAGNLLGTQINQEDGAGNNDDRDRSFNEKSAHGDSNRQKVSNFNQGSTGNPAFDMIFDEIDKLRNKFDDFVHVDDFDEMGNLVDDLHSKIAQITKQGGFKIELAEEMDEFTQSEDGSPIAAGKSDHGSQIHEDNDELIEGDASKNQLRRQLSLINDNMADNDTLKGKHISPSDVGAHIKETQSNNPNTSKLKSKELSPSKKSYYNPMMKRGSRGGTTKTLAEVRKIIEKWPKVEQVIEELKESEKVLLTPSLI